MTNQEQPRRRASNRQRLVDAGHQILSEKGMEAATVKEIARVAGVSPGLFHYYFASKDELLLAILEDAGERFEQRLLQQSAPRGSARQRVAASVAFIAETARHDPDLFRLRYEFYALGLRRPGFRPAVGGQVAHIKANIARNLGRWFPDAEPDRVAALAALVLACFDGLALQAATDPSADLAPTYDLLRRVMETELAIDEGEP